MPIRKMIDRKMSKLSGATNWIAIAPSAPPTPVYIADTPKVSDLTIAVLMPIASAAVCWSRIAIMARPMRPRSRFQANANMTSVTTRVKKYSQRSWLSGMPIPVRKAGASGFEITMPWTPPVSFSRWWYLRSCGRDTPRANVASARYRPSRRSAGSPNRNPAIRQIAPAAGRVAQ